ncbi:MAG: hypothetical protein HC848_04885, partial [Limnobacter sp.]|nr:hypothetical protein [Limnobacter sp.]
TSQRETLINAVQAYDALSTTLKTYAGNSLDTRKMRIALAECQQHFDRLTQQRLLAAKATEKSIQTTDSKHEMRAINERVEPELHLPHFFPATNERPVSIYLENRQQALKQLQQVADFFRENEPHSPMSYAIERTVRWGQLPLIELMKELITDANALENISSFPVWFLHQNPKEANTNS